jgi:hypothetical protein
MLLGHLDMFFVIKNEGFTFKKLQSYLPMHTSSSDVSFAYAFDPVFIFLT